MNSRFQGYWRGLGAGTRVLLGIWIAGSLTGWVMGVMGVARPFAGLGLADAAWAQLQVWRLATYALVSADVAGFFLGGLLVAWLGSAVELKWERRWFLAYYLICAASAGSGAILLASTAAEGVLTNAGAILGLIVAWHDQQRGRQFLLFGGPQVSAGIAAGAMAAGVVMSIGLAGGWLLALGLGAGGFSGWVALKLGHAMAARRADHASAQPRIGRLEL